MKKLTKILRKKARSYRKHATSAEIEFEKILNRRKIRNMRHKSVGIYVVDFIIPYRMLLIDIEGDLPPEPDQEYRDKWLTSFGFRVLKIQAHEIKKFNTSILTSYPIQTLKTFSDALTRASWGNANVAGIRTIKEIKILKKVVV